MEEEGITAMEESWFLECSVVEAVMDAIDIAIYLHLDQEPDEIY